MAGPPQKRVEVMEPDIMRSEAMATRDRLELLETRGRGGGKWESFALLCFLLFCLFSFFFFSKGK